MFAKKSKCHFGTSQVEYLAHIIYGGQVRMDLSKVEGILNWPTPHSIKDLRRFLGLSVYYKRFIRGYGLLARPLTKLLKKNVTWKWNEEMQKSFQQLKEAICQAPVLTLLDFQKPFCVETDASEVEVGAVLQQQGKPVAFFSKA